MAWKSFIRRLILLLVLLGGGTWGTLLVLDPYGRGTLTPIRSAAVPDTSPRLTKVAQGRDPRFDSAVIGNSTIQLLKPARLDAETGLEFVQLSIPGTGPAEQIAVLEWFARNHGDRARAVVIGLDSSWCHAGAAVDRKAVSYPFPFWLYGGDADYALRLANLIAAGDAAVRVKVLLGWDRAAPADGYDDYDTGHKYDLAKVRARMRSGVTRAGEDAPPPPEPAPADATYPALEQLGRVLRTLPFRAVLVFPPVFAAAGGHMQGACVATAAALGVPVLDFDRRGPATRRIESFRDSIHYRQDVARLIELGLADVLDGKPVRAEVAQAFGGDPRIR